jgi:P27 family predicted phage terminase small subunit
MTTCGPKTRPAHLKLLAGNPGKRRIPDEIQPFRLPEPPEPPSFLDAYGVEEWQRLAPELHRLRLLSVVDQAALAGYCASFSRWRNAEEVLKLYAARDPAVRGLMVKGARQGIENPMVYIARTSAKEMLRFATEFGFTPAARARIAAGVEGVPQTSRFGDLLA